MELHIKNMVCNRCILVVAGIFKDAGFEKAKVQMGTVILEEELEDRQFAEIQEKLNQVGFEIINDAKSRIIERIKQKCIDYIYGEPEKKNENFSDYLSAHLHHEYNYLSSLFSSVEGVTIEKHLINLKIERVKELLVYDEKTLSEIAYELGYSSVAHLSGQFKKVTGFTPSYFKKLGDQKRKSIDGI